MIEEEKAKLEEEELKKNKKKSAPAAKKGQEDVKWEEIQDPEDIELYTIQNPIPCFEKGAAIFNSEYFFELDEMLCVVKEFRRKIFDFLSRKKKECLADAEIHDKEFLQLSLHLLDERLKSYYSMKGKIQTEIYRVRGGEITKHKEKYQLHVKGILDSIDDQTDRFNFFHSEIFDSKQSHTDQMLEL